MNIPLRAASADAEASQLVDAWAEELGRRAGERLRRDLAQRLPPDRPTVDRLASVMVGATFDAMRRDVRSIVVSGSHLGEVAAGLSFVWRRVLGA